MKIYLDNNLGVTNVEQEELTQDTYGYNILKVYIPNAVLTPYDTFTCYYGALLQNGRKVGWFAMEARTSSDADYEENYTLYKATIEQCIVSVEGKVYIGCQVLLGNSGNATLIKKNTAVVQFNVRKSVAINNDILVLDTDQTTTDVLESYKNLLENALTTYATKATTYTKTEVDGKLALKADKSDTYTKQEINEAATSMFDELYGYTDQVRTTTEHLEKRTLDLENDVADLKSVQNVVEVVPTYSALQSYDTSKLGIDDKVQVIADETHDGASTIYNWDGTQWQYVGAYGTNSYTKQESDNKFAPKTTAVTHTGNQLKDNNGNNIYPKIANNSVTPEKTSFISFSKNLFDKNNVLDGYIRSGTFTSNSTWRCNLEYRVLLSHTITVSNNTNCIIDIYDENKTYLSNQVLTNDVTYNIRSDAKYIRISVEKNRVDTFQCEFGNSATTYEEYHKPQFNSELDAYVLNSEFNDLTKNLVKNTYIFNRLPFNTSMQFNINDFTYIADGFWNGATVVSSLSGRKVYKLENVIKYIDTIQLSSGSSANTLYLYDSNGNLKLTINNNTLYKLHTYIDDGGYIMMNYWGASGDEAYSKTITLKTFDVEVINKPKITIRTCVKKPFNFNGKTALFFGDSITVGFNGTTTVVNNYVKLFSDKVGLTYTNDAIGGSLFTRGKNEIECIIDTIKNTTLNTDYIFIAGGCNDWQLGVTTSEFDDAMNELFTYLDANYNGEVIFISPIEHINNGWWGRNAINDMNIYRNIIGEYCMKYSYSFIDTSKFNFYSENNTFNNLFYGDGLHPSELGYKLYANSLLNVLC